MSWQTGFGTLVYQNNDIISVKAMLSNEDDTKCILVEIFGDEISNNFFFIAVL